MTTDAIDPEIHETQLRLAALLLSTASFSREIIAAALANPSPLSQFVTGMALTYGILEMRYPTAEEVETGNFAAGQIVPAFTAEFSALLDLYDTQHGEQPEIAEAAE